MNMFNKIQIKKPKYNKFDLSYENKLSMNMGELIPIVCEEIVPGDKFKVSSEVFIRLAPMLAPVMHRVNVFTHYFFVPNRLVWDEWKDFITGGEDGLSAPVFPTCEIDETKKSIFAKGKLPDYFGIPIVDPAVTVTDIQSVSALPFRAYQEVYNEYYRDQNLTPKVDFNKGGGQQTLDEMNKICVTRRRAWEKDYFTSALPWPQRGADVSLPVNSEFSPQYADPARVYVGSSGGAAATGDLSGQTGDLNYLDGVSGNQPAYIENLADPQQVDSTSVTINELRIATRLQEWLEKNARGGSRYIEQILSHFGVRSSDARLQRPEYLGGGKSPVIISETLQTSSTKSDVQEFDTPLGEMAGHGVSMGKTNSFTKRFEEHGYVIGIVSVLPRTTYQQGIERKWTKFDKLDYYWPEFAHLGEQEITQNEIYHDPTAPVGTGKATFGYTPRYAEYKYNQSRISGDFRDTLKYWHMGRFFETAPALNTEFVEAVPTKDIFAVTDQTEDVLYCQIYNKIHALRPMPYFGTPYL